MPAWRVIGLAVLVVAGGLTAAPAPPDAAARRQAVLALRTKGAAAVPALQQALADPNNLVRRAAARVLSGLGEPGRPALRAALGNSDALVRRIAVGALLASADTAALAVAAEVLQDPDELLRLSVVSALAAWQPRTEAVLKLLQQAKQDASLEVRRPAQEALWPFHKESLLFRQRPDIKDVLTRVKVTATVAVPPEGWWFRLDPTETGHEQNWFAPALPTADWKPIVAGQYWQQAGYEYEGVAWYRRNLTLPARPEHQAAELSFQAVDESAWVWINGEYVGQHDIGPLGWDKPFALDVSGALRWGQDNQITVRVLNTKFAGGIWKPVQIECLALR
ncbi:MAG: HEAT repeat domain-containing protein [Fimbriimonadaceae bacterium]|nr:HEAT repeat domain-containing protein [Fimbriimonadaceae bacterium]